MRVVRRVVLLVVLVALGAFVWWFARHNGAPVEVALPGLAPLADVPLWVALLAAFALGLALAGLLGVLEAARLGLRLRRRRKEAEKLAAELHQLRNLPLVTGDEAAPRGSAGGAPDVREPARSAEPGG